MTYSYIFFLQYKNVFDAIWEKLEPTKEWEQDVKYENHPSNVTDLYWLIKPSQIYPSGATEPKMVS